MYTMTSTYAPYSLNIDRKHAQGLMKGGAVRLKPDNLTGDVPVQLTKSQINKIKKAIAAGKGTTLRFSQKQLKHHIGSGFFSNLLKSAVKTLAPAVSNALGGLAQQATTSLVNSGAQAIQNRLSPQQAGTGIEGGGAPKRRGRKPKAEMDGGALFSMLPALLGLLGSGAHDAQIDPSVLDKPRKGGKKSQLGTSFLPSGY